MGSATLAFGLVSIPVKVFPTSVTESGIRFNMLEEKTGARLKQQYISTVTGDLVSRDEMIKGYEFAKGQYVTFTNDELKSFEAEANKSVDIKEFVPIDKIDPIHFEKTYYLGPDKGAPDNSHEDRLARHKFRSPDAVSQPLVDRFDSRWRCVSVRLRRRNASAVDARGCSP